MDLENHRGRDLQQGTRLGISEVIIGTLGFSLRHIVAFFLLGLLVNLPTYLHSLLPRKVLRVGPGGELPEGWEVPEPLVEGIEMPRAGWETAFAIPVIEMVLFGFAVGIIAQTLLRDRRGENWTVFAGLVEVRRKFWTILGVGVLCGLASGTVLLVVDLIPVTVVALIPLYLIAALILCPVMPCAAIQNLGVIDCFDRSAELTAGSRLRILAVYLLIAAITVGIAAVAFGIIKYGSQMGGYKPSHLSSWIVSALGSVYFLPLLAVIHEALVALKGGSDASASPEVFD